MKKICKILLLTLGLTIKQSYANIENAFGSKIFYIIFKHMGNRSLMDRTLDSDSSNAGSIPAGCIFKNNGSLQGSCRYLSMCVIENSSHNIII